MVRSENGSILYNLTVLVVLSMRKYGSSVSPPNCKLVTSVDLFSGMGGFVQALTSIARPYCRMISRQTRSVLKLA
jgi:hypothetical protein